MSMWMEGTFTDEERQQFESAFTYVASRAKGDEFDGVNYEDGWSDLYDVIALWNLLGSDKGQKLKKLLKEEIEVEGAEDENGAYTITIPQIKQILDLMEGLDDALLRLADDSGYVRPDKLDYVLQKSPNLAVQRSKAD